MYFVDKKMQKYRPDIEQKMKLFFSRLPEKHQRHYAAQEAVKLGWGGKSYISELFEISHRRIYRGEKELNSTLLYAETPKNMQRRAGGGRKKKKLVKQN